jgi:hypothetical protein
MVLSALLALQGADLVVLVAEQVLRPDGQLGDAGVVHGDLS